jgi:hypothetical protein
MTYNVQVVTDEDQCQPQISLEIGQQIENLSLNGNIQGAHRFIRDEQFRFSGQRTRDAYALPLPAGKPDG